MIIGSRKRYVAVGSIFLIAVGLVGGLVGCNGGGSYTLTVDSTAGGLVTVPGEGTFSYGAGTVVELVAAPDDGHKFQAWHGDIEGIADPNSASTNITINGDCSVTASFEEEGGPGPSDPYQ
jgi:hypothetical protein